MKKDYYDILGVPKNASRDDIKRAYRILAQQYHPDRNNGNDKRFKEINEAYRILSGEKSRVEYDQMFNESSQSDNSKSTNQNTQSTEPFSTNKTKPQSIKRKNRVGLILFLIGLILIIILIANATNSSGTDNNTNNVTTNMQQSGVYPPISPNQQNNNLPTATTNQDSSQTASTNSSSEGCPAGAFFNAITGASCIPGCVAGALFSSTTGLSCSGNGTCADGSTFDKDTGHCISDLTYCQNTYGANATYDATDNKCDCTSGYTMSNGTCVNQTGGMGTAGTQINFQEPTNNGYSVCAAMNATWDGTYLSDGKYNCTCDSGYTPSSDGTTCVATGY